MQYQPNGNLKLNAIFAVGIVLSITKNDNKMKPLTSWIIKILRYSTERSYFLLPELFYLYGSFHIIDCLKDSVEDNLFPAQIRWQFDDWKFLAELFNIHC